MWYMPKPTETALTVSAAVNSYHNMVYCSALEYLSGRPSTAIPPDRLPLSDVPAFWDEIAARLKGTGWCVVPVPGDHATFRAVVPEVTSAPGAPGAS